MLLKITKIIWGLFCLLFIIATIADFEQASKHPEFYRFGADFYGGDWNYKTQINYLWSNVIFFFWFAVGLYFCLRQHKVKKLKWGIMAHIVISLLWVFIIPRIAGYY